MREYKQPQQYDSTLKALFSNEAAEILPRLLPHIELLGEQNIEIDRTTLKADLVYFTHYKGQPHILNMELQTSADSQMAVRLLQYHVGLLAKYNLPIISVVMYPFETPIPQPPFEERSEDELLLTLHYKVLALWLLEAERFVHDHAVSIYTLLPAMKGANAHLLIRALREMREHYPNSQFGHHLIRFHKILLKSKTLSEQEKQRVKEELHMQYSYDWFIDENEDVLERVAKGEVKGLLWGLQRSILQIVKQRFPALVATAEQEVQQVQQPEALDQLIKELVTAPDEATAQHVLQLSLTHTNTSSDQHS